MKFFAILSAVTFAVVILGISIIQVRGLAPGEEMPDTWLVNPNSELSLYLADPGYLATVTWQRLVSLATFDKADKASYLSWLAEQRAETARELLESDRLELGLWTLRKAFVYQSRAIGLLAQVSQESQPQLAEKLAIQAETFGQIIDQRSPFFPENKLAEVNLLRSLLTDNTQAINTFLPAGE